MSDKTYTPDQVAKKVLEKIVDLEKGLFAEQGIKCSSPDKAEDTKESVFREIKWALDDIKCLKELSWTVEQEAPGAKDMFDKEFESKKAKLATLIRRHKALKKSEDTEEEDDALAKADEIWKAEKVVEVKEGVVTPEKKEIKKADDSKLKAFIENKKAKKTSQMEKTLGMNQGAPAAASTGTEAPKPKSIGAQIGFPGITK